MHITSTATLMFFLPLFSASLSGLFLRKMSPSIAQSLTIGAMGLSLICAIQVFSYIAYQNDSVIIPLYTALQTKDFSLSMGLYLDRLSMSMALMVTIISFLVHIFSLDYMKDDPCQPRFFAYISLFTFMMLVLLLADNLIMLFVGWEGVGLVSYLLIGFWMTKQSAVFANLKAFLVNRVGDLGLILAIAGIFFVTKSFNYQEIFYALGKEELWNQNFQFAGYSFGALEFIATCMFIGAMGKSAQVPLHLWLPDSMEGPTPISALIHAATMVTAGIFMVSRFDQLYLMTPHTSDFILVIGSVTSLFMGLVGLVQYDIKRIVAYSTLSQLGYMVIALGLGAYNVAIFHLLTHAFFKALLFLGAGALIIAMHHQQDIRSMGGLWKSHPILLTLMMIGSLSLMGLPPFAGFYSKDLIILAAEHHVSPWAHFAYSSALLGVFITSLYSLRLLYYVFLKEPVNQVRHIEPVGFHAVWPLCPLAFFAIYAGFTGYDLIFHENFLSGLSGVTHADLDKWLHHHTSAWDFALHGLKGLPMLFILLATAVLALIYGPLSQVWQALLRTILKPFVFLLEQKYGFDLILERFFIPLSRSLGHLGSTIVDSLMIDKLLVDSQADISKAVGKQLRSFNSGVIQNYVAVMTISIVIISVLIH